MNWDAIGAVAELLGAAGVIASLVYLAVQIRQNTLSVRTTAYQGLLNDIQTLNSRLFDREFNELTTSFFQEPTKLDPVDLERGYSWFGSVLRHHQNAFHQYREGVITKRQWEALTIFLPHLLASQGGKFTIDRLSAIGERTDPEFLEFVRRLRDEAAA